MELWKPIEDFPNYEVSNEGRVKNVKLDRIMARHINRTGTVYVRLTNNHRPSTRGVSLLVAHAFVPSRYPKWFDTPINLDGDRNNNAAVNLMWRPRWFAIQYHKQFDRETYKFKGNIVLTDTKEIFHTLREPAVKYGLLEKQILVDITNQEGVFPQGFLFNA